MPELSKPPEGPGEKPTRLYFKTYLQMIENSVGTNMFCNFYVHTENKGEFDALDNGDNACAFYVSAVLKIFDKIAGVHGLVDSTVKDMKNSGWQVAKAVQPGDVIVWEVQEFADGNYEHIGFSLGGNRAASTSSKTGQVVEHDLYFGEISRPIKQIFRLDNWDS